MKKSYISKGYLLPGVLTAAGMLCLPGVVSAQDEESLHIGYAAQVERSVEGQIGEADFVPVQIDDDIFFNEIITTEPDASAVMSFRDGSTLEIGPNSALTIDEFVFNPVEGVKTQTVTALVGSFRFVSGMAMPNQTITINTPTATLGIRGSITSFVVDGGGATAAVPINGTASFTSSVNPNATINIATGETGVIIPGGQPVTGLSVRAVGRQVISRTRSTFGVRFSPPAISPARQARDATANQTPVEAQQQAAPATQTLQNSLAAVINARQSETMDSLGIDSVAQLDNAGVLTASQDGATLSGAQQTVVDSLDATTAQLQTILDAAQADATVTSQSAHEQGTANVITGLSQSGDADAVAAATNNAAQADSNQAAPAVGAAAANLPNLDATTMTEVLQNAVDGLQASGNATGDAVGTLTATAINNMDASTQQSIGNTVAATVTSDFAAQNPGQAAQLAATLTTQLTGNTSEIASNTAQNLANQLPAQAGAINTAATNAAAANIAALPATAAGVPQFQPVANTLTATATSSGPNIEEAAVITETAIIPVSTTESLEEPDIIVPETTTLHVF